MTESTTGGRPKGTTGKTHKRTRGEGSIYFEASRNRYVGVVTVEGRRRKVTGKTKTDVSAKLGRLIHTGEATPATTSTEATEGDVEGEGMTVAELLDSWYRLSIATDPKRAPQGRQAHERAARTISAELGRRVAADLKPRDVEAMFVKLADPKGRNLGAASLVKIRSTMSQAYKWAIRRSELSFNPAAVAELPETKSANEKRALSIDEVEKLTHAAAEHPHGILWLLGMRLGLRPGEAAGLTVEALDLDAVDEKGKPRPVVSITRAVHLDNGTPILGDRLKTRKSRRALEVPADLVGPLRVAIGRVVEGLLVRDENDGPVWPSTVRAELSKTLDALGIEDATPNELRHTFATIQSEAGVPIHKLADLLGHTDTRMVERYYRHRPAVIGGVI